MSFQTSVWMLALSVAGFIGFSVADKRTASNLCRMLTSLCGVMGMLAVFFVLFHAAVYLGVI